MAPMEDSRYKAAGGGAERGGMMQARLQSVCPVAASQRAFMRLLLPDLSTPVLPSTLHPLYGSLHIPFPSSPSRQPLSQDSPTVPLDLPSPAPPSPPFLIRKHPDQLVSS